MEEPLMPSGLNRPVMARPTPVDHLEKIVDLLQAAILAGDSDRAKQIAERLATEKVKLSIQLNKEDHEQRLTENSISVKVHVEDRETSGCPINLRVKPSDTIGDLKRRMCFEYEFPVEVQRWIIGKRIPKDIETLHRCGVRGSSHVHTLYLYLTTARSVGLDQNPIDAGTRGAVGGEISGDYMTMGPLREARNQPASGQRSGRTPNRQSSNLSSVSNATLSPVSEAGNPSSFNSSATLHASGSTPVLGQTQGKPQGQGLGRGQRQSAPDLSDTVFVSGPPVVSGGLQASQAGLQAGNTPAQRAQDNIGWECTRCTFINKPTRPGCEVCGGDRPLDYEVPIGYIMSKEELCWLAEDEDQKRMLEEAKGQRGGEAGNEEHLTEEQLDLILRFNDALVDLQQSQGGEGAEALLAQNVINLQAKNARTKNANNPQNLIPRGDVHVPSDDDNTDA